MKKEHNKIDVKRPKTWCCIDMMTHDITCELMCGSIDQLPCESWGGAAGPLERWSRLSSPSVPGPGTPPGGTELQ